MINVIKASAGSGKTFRLTYEYIKLLLGNKHKGRFVLAPENEHNRHRHILAVTFTNKATGEMKERIVKELSILAGKVPNKTSLYLTDLCEEFGNISPEKITIAANRAMVELLFDYTNFNVSTIDSFFQMILRTFAKELKMSYNYEVELDDNYAINVGVNDFLSNITHDKDANFDKNELKRIRRTKAWIKEFIKEEVVNKKSWNIFFESESKNAKIGLSHSFSLNEFAKNITKEELRTCLDDIISYLEYHETDSTSTDYIMLFKSYIYKQIEAIKKHATIQAKEILCLSETDKLTVDDLSSKGGLAWILKISSNNIDCGLGVYKTAKILESVDKSDKWFKKGKTKNSPRLSVNTIGSIVRCINEIAECNSRFLIFKEIHRNIFMLGLLGEISRYLSKFRKENELILLADTNELLRKIINNEDTPFVYERVGIWLSHFLIDEFQDTSKAQWENMKPLLYNSCAEGGDNLIIGDEKQCIYRFRNADPTLLRTEVGKHFTVKQNDKGKSINWRSTPHVVEFNNEFFSNIAPMLGAADEYANVIQDLPANKHYDNEGYVEVSFIDEKSKGENDSVEKKFKDIALERLPSLINDLVSRGYEYKDIAVLVETNSDGADVIKCILDYNASAENEKQKINVISNESLLLRNSPAVRLIISHLRYFDSKILYSETENDSNSSKIKDINGYMHRVLRNYESLMVNSDVDPGVAIEQSFATVPPHDDAMTMSLSALLPENTESFNIISITEHIIAQNISQDDLLHENAFIQAFQDCVVDFSNRQNASIHEFLKWWDGGGCNISVNSPDGQNAINVLTIHKSKGLEFGCVILPFCDWDLEGKEEVLWIPKDVAVNSGFFDNLDEKLIPPIIPLLPKIDMNLEHSGLADFYEKKRKSRIIDSLNKTYVGFTRAVDELYIFTPTPNDKTSPTKMNSLLAILPLQEDGVFRAGAKGHVTSEHCTKNETEKMPLYKVENTKIEYTVPDLYDNEQRTRGTRLHKILKKIRYKDDVDSALHYFSVKGVIPRDCYDDDRKILLEALEDERVQEWFDSRNRVYNERSMISGMGKRRPDRFIVTPDGRTIVIDYKFGNIHKTSYKEQVQEYLNILTEIGFKNVEGYLWYPLEQYIEKVN